MDGQCWIGGGEGPAVIDAAAIRRIPRMRERAEITDADAREFAQYSAQILEAQRYGERSVGRYQVLPIPDDKFYLRDDIPLKVDYDTAYQLETEGQ